jgi:hypothetical protein
MRLLTGLLCLSTFAVAAGCDGLAEKSLTSEIEGAISELQCNANTCQGPLIPFYQPDSASNLALITALVGNATPGASPVLLIVDRRTIQEENSSRKLENQTLSITISAKKFCLSGSKVAERVVMTECQPNDAVRWGLLTVPGGALLKTNGNLCLDSNGGRAGVTPVMNACDPENRNLFWQLSQ